MIYCLMTSGLPLTGAMRDYLLVVARQMATSGDQKRAFRTDDFEGAIYTKGQSATIGTVSGVHFTAVIESNQITTRVSYIVPRGELPEMDELEWVSLFPEAGFDPSLN